MPPFSSAQMDEQQTSPVSFRDRTTSRGMLGLFSPETYVQNGTPLRCFLRRLERPPFFPFRPKLGAAPKAERGHEKCGFVRLCLPQNQSCRGGREGNATRASRQQAISHISPHGRVLAHSMTAAAILDMTAGVLEDCQTGIPAGKQLRERGSTTTPVEDHPLGLRRAPLNFFR
jgi:hypothetical protein